MSIEFYGEISEYTKKQTERLKRKYFALWLYILAGLLLVVSVVLSITKGGLAFLVSLVFAVLLGVAGFVFPIMPFGKKIDAPLKVRVTIDGDTVVWTQYLAQKETQRKKKVQEIKKVLRTKSCYYLIYNDISNAIVCERCLLKRGTFDAFEMCFEGKVVSKRVE